MSPSREKKLLQLIVTAHEKPPATRSLRTTLIGTTVWAIAAFSVLFVVGGRGHITWQTVALVLVGFAVGGFTIYDIRRQASSEQWPLFSRYLDINAVKARLNELRT